MNKSRIALIGIIILIVGAIALVVAVKPKSESMHMPKSIGEGAEAPKAANAVNIQNYSFAPNPLKIKKGTTVTWTNKDIARHNIVVDSGQPAGGPNGPLIGKGGSYAFTFKTAGTYKYHCSPHPYMHGTVEVTE